LDDYSPGLSPEQAKRAHPRPSAADRAAGVSLLLLGLLCGSAARLDMDFHWHLALGQDFVAKGFPAAEPFSHLPAGTPDRQAWLSDAVFAVLDRIGGLALIRAVLGVVFAAGCLSVFRLARRGTRSTALALVPVAVYLALSTARLRARPDLFTLALLPLFVELIERTPSWRRALDLLLVSALWANLHPGSLLAGLVAVTQLWPLSRLRAVNAAATWIGLCLTPSGLAGLLVYAADTTGLRPLIPEWQRIWERPLAEFGPEWAVVGGVALLLAAALAVRMRAGSPTPAAPPGAEAREGARAIMGVALAASAVRFLFALVLPALWATRILDRVVAPRPALRALALAGAVALIVVFPIGQLREAAAGLRAAGASWLGAEPPGYPVGAAEFLARSELSGNLGHPARWGGYLAWKLRPRFKTATDGRVTHFGADLAREWSVGVDSPAREEIFARRGIDLVVVPREMLPTFLDSQPYEPLYADDLAVVLLRLEGPHAEENVALLKAAAKERKKAQIK
jgi:hypothetical protein